MRALRFSACVCLAAIILLASLPVYSAIGFTAEDVYASVFVIYSGNSLGSGFAVGENCIVTNAHVIADPYQVAAMSYDGTTYEASVLGMDENRDLAVLGVKNASFPYLLFADVSQMKIGDDIYAIGAPKSMSYTLTKGVVSARERKIGAYNYIQIDAAVNEGNSGGPLVDDAGHVLGVNTLKVVDSEGIGLAIPATVVRAYLEELGFTLDAAGNVLGAVQIPERAARPEPEEPAPTPVERSSPAVTIALGAVAAISLVTNVVLAILLARRKKTRPLGDPTERTDFDIDLLE